MLPDSFVTYVPDYSRGLLSSPEIEREEVIRQTLAQRYRALSSSRPGAFYMLDVDGGDVSCTCRGFEYRGACTHARELKKALTGGGATAEWVRGGDRRRGGTGLIWIGEQSGN